ncbi:MAG: fascin domain-containing protein [Vicingaceae bacterium]
MKKTLFTCLVFVGLIYSSCDNSIPVKERILKQGSKINLKSTNGNYLCSNWDMLIYADKEIASDWEVFLIKESEDNKYVLQAHTNKYLSANLGNDKELESNRGRASDWEKFDLIEINDSTIALMASNGKYLSVADDYKLYAVSDTITTSEEFIVTFLNKK